MNKLRAPQKPLQFLQFSIEFYLFRALLIGKSNQNNILDLLQTECMSALSATWAMSECYYKNIVLLVVHASKICTTPHNKAHSKNKD